MDWFRMALALVSFGLIIMALCDWKHDDLSPGWCWYICGSAALVIFEQLGKLGA